MATIRYNNEAEVAEYLARFYGKTEAPVNSALPATDRKPLGHHEPSEKAEVQEAHQRFRVVIHSKCRRLTDSGGRRVKALVDGLVAGGLLGDDNPDWIPQQPSQTQEKSDWEETLVEVWEIESVPRL
jgi:hypothetical protein